MATTREARGVADHVDELRALLVAERAHVAAQLESLRHRFDDIVAAAELTSTDDEHDPEGATIAYERAQVTALARQAEHDLAAIDAAIEHFADGSVGICAECGGPIAWERLVALPEPVAPPRVGCWPRAARLA